MDGVEDGDLKLALDDVIGRAQNVADGGLQRQAPVGETIRCLDRRDGAVDVLDRDLGRRIARVSWSS